MQAAFFRGVAFAGMLVAFWSCQVLAGPGLLAHKVVAGDTVRSLLLTYNCVRSMTEYGQLKETFAKANAGLANSGQLKPGSTILVPSGPRQKGCLPLVEQRLVRVEFEVAPGMEMIRLYLDGPVLPDMFLLRDPPPTRMVCDFDQTLPQAGLQREMDTQGRLVRKIRIGHQDKPFKRARVVLEMDRDLAGRVDQDFFEKSSVFQITVHENSKL